mgnify:FL=1
MQLIVDVSIIGKIQEDRILVYFLVYNINIDNELLHPNYVMDVYDECESDGCCAMVDVVR